jgi:hypothetical protein
MSHYLAHHEETAAGSSSYLALAVVLAVLAILLIALAVRARRAAKTTASSGPDSH